MTKKALFDQICEHLLTQRVQARGGARNRCRYHAADGRKCAIGCLIPESRYTVRIENLVLGHLLREYAEVFPPGVRGCVKRNKRLARDLQLVHDHDQPQEWPQKLLRVAKEYKVRPSKALLDAVEASEAAT